MRLTLFFLMFLTSNFALAQSEDQFLGIMAAGKLAGACGILNSMLYFQETTKMPGGDEFVSRFWATEATRLGLSMKEYSNRCDRAIELYDNVWSEIENASQ